MLGTLLHHDPDALGALASGGPTIRGAITCVKLFSDGGLSVCDFGETVDDVLAVKVLGSYAPNDMTGIEVILSDVDPAGWTGEELQLHQIRGIWRFPVLVRSAASRRIRGKIPPQGGWRYLVFYTNPDAQATGDANLTVVVLRKRVVGFRVLNSVATEVPS